MAGSLRSSRAGTPAHAVFISVGTLSAPPVECLRIGDGSNRAIANAYKHRLLLLDLICLSRALRAVDRNRRHVGLLRHFALHFSLGLTPRTTRVGTLRR